MHFVTEEFLADLRSDAAASTADDGLSSGITDIWVDEEAPIFEIDVISDLRIDSPAPTPDVGSLAIEPERPSAAITDRLKQLLKAFKVSRPADLLVNCGDLIAGRRDSTEGELRRVQSLYEDVCLPAFLQLQEADQTRSRMGDTDQIFPKLLSLPGDGDAYEGGGSGREAWGPAPLATAARRDAYPYYSHFAKGLAANRLPEKPESHPVAAVFRVLPRSADRTAGRLECAPLAFIAVIGFDSNDVQYKHELAINHGQIDDEQLRWSRRLIDTLMRGVAHSAPLYVVGLTHHNLLPLEDRVVHPSRGEEDERLVRFRKLMSSGHTGICDPLPRLCVTNHFLAENAAGSITNASGFLSHCQQVRASLIVHTNMHQRAVATLVSTPLVAGQPPSELTVLAAPAFSSGRPTSGMARISLDLWKGQAEIAVHYETAPDGGPATNPTQVICPLVSASRVASSERRLYGKVSGLVASALANSSPKDRGTIQDFADYVAAVWDSDGYAPVSFPDGSLPQLGAPTRMNRYYLLLLLRQAKDGNYEMLLSRHNATRPSEVAEWDTLLMPAFSSVRDLMERLHLDVVRQVVTQAEDIERASSAKTFDAAVELIRGGGGNIQDDIWLEKIRELDTVHKIKISPTTGEITDYEYRLVVLSPFVRDPRSVNPNQIADKRRRQQLLAELAVVGWLSELPSVRLPGAPLDDRHTVPMEAIMSGGAGLRWEPSADPDDPDDISEDDRCRVVLPPGAVWFPLPDTDEPEGPWTMAPSIVARNADVMRWVDSQLAKRRSAEGLFPPHIVLGQMRETRGYSLSDGPFPFAHADDHNHNETDNLSRSTMEAMSRVEYTDEYDLRGQRPYHGLDIRRTALVRRSIRVRSGRERDTILVFDATARRECGRDLSYFKTCPLGPDSGLLGILRPAQRYVLQAGLERAGWVNDFMAKKCGDDPWGFLRAKYGGAGEPLALTPPIIELVHPDDWDSDDENVLEFVVCDGNHRIVRKVWNGRDVAAGIGVVSPPRQPYYARPFSPYEWDITAENVLSVTPEPRFRYAPRHVDLKRLDLSVEARQELSLKPSELLYRRYYRDLNYGFGPVGGQGGRYV